jgi:hypothetical protein
MKKLNIQIILVLSVLLFAGCSARRVVQYQTRTDSTSTINVKPSTTIKNVVVTLAGKLVREKTRRVKSLEIQNVPKGNHELRVTSASWIYKDEINFTKNITVDGTGDKKTELVSIPPYSTGYWVYTGIIYVAIVAPWLFL